MSQRKLVWKALKEAGLLETDDPRLQEFVQHIRSNPTRCWSDFVADFRERYYDVFDQVVSALQGANDPAIRNLLLKFADPGRPKEQQLILKIANETNFEQDKLAAKRLGTLNNRQVNEILRQRVAVAAPPTRPRRRTSS